MSAEHTRLVRAIAGKSGPTMTMCNYLVSVVIPGASRDGVAQVSIRVGTADLAVPYLTDAYPSPTAGDTVAVLLVAGSPLILGRVGGLPTF